jgi:hypothetical protein
LRPFNQETTARIKARGRMRLAAPNQPHSDQSDPD